MKTRHINRGTPGLKGCRRKVTLRELDAAEERFYRMFDRG